MKSLNILVVGEANTWFDRHVIASLRDLGHCLSDFHYGNGVGEFYPHSRHAERERKNRDLVRQAQALKADRSLDLIFCYVYDDFLLPEAAAALRALDVPMVNYNVDMINQWYRQIRTARYFTVMLCAQRAHMKDVARCGAPVRYFPMAARAPAAEGGARIEIPAMVTFAGTPTPYRIAVLRRLDAAGVALAIYGKFWREGAVASADRNLEKTLRDIFSYGLPRLRAEGFGALWAALMSRLDAGQHARPQNSVDPSLLHGFLPDQDMPLLFRDSKINLGFTRMAGDDPARPGTTQVKLRDFEVPASGGFYLVEHVAEYAELFTPGREVETWRTVDELIDKLRYYLAHDKERAAIAAAGRRRALGEHLWSHRFAGLFAELGIH